MSFTQFRLATILVAGALIGTVGTPVIAQSAQPAPSGACFDINRSFSGAAEGSILINRCTGRTWIMVASEKSRGDQLAYRWVPVAMAGAVPQPSSAVAAIVTPAPAIPANPRCFTFAGKKYCE
jgi:hypothetical protein